MNPFRFIWRLANLAWQQLLASERKAEAERIAHIEHRNLFGGDEW